VVEIGDEIARAHVSGKLEKLTAESQNELERLDVEIGEARLELAITRAELDKKSQEKNRIEKELDRVSAEPLLVSDCVRLRKSLDGLEKNTDQLQEKIAGLHQEIAQLEKKRLQSIDTTTRERTRLRLEAATQASFSGKILRIDRHPEGEKIRLSVLYQQGSD
jgi:predicted nuclease with TOPRIM domain